MLDRSKPNQEEIAMDLLLEEEMEMLLDEIPHATSTHPILPNFHPFHDFYRNEGSSSGSSSLSGNISPVSDDPFRYSPELRRPAAEAAWRMVDELGLLDQLRAMHIQEEKESAIRVPPVPFGINPIDPYAYVGGVQGAIRRWVLENSPIDDGRTSLVPVSYPNCLFAGEDVMGSGRDLVSSVHLPSLDEAYGFLDPLPKLHCGPEEVNWGVDTLLNGWSNPHPLSPVRNPRDIAFDCDDSFVIHGKGVCSVERKKWQHYERSRTKGSHVNLDNLYGPKPHSAPCMSSKYDNLMDAQGYIYRMAKDQHGCRFLQQKLDEGKPEEVEAIFNEIIDHVVELMVNPFGNYLMQKLLDVCSEEQRMRVLCVLTKNPSDLVRISLNTHGTRAVQKLVETVKTKQQIALVILALKPGFRDLIKDSNGNHVVQRCLESLSHDDNKFIFDAAARYCVDIATHQHGCRVLQSCIAHSTGQHRANLMAEISLNGLRLAQDIYGNYAVQYVLGLKNSSTTANLASQFKGNYVLLSTQKYSSNVVEKCLKVFREVDRARVINELLSVPRFEQLLQDPFANYVIQSALESSKGPHHAALVEAIRPHAAVLRTSPYCKRIFSRVPVKK